MRRVASFIAGAVILVVIVAGVFVALASGPGNDELTAYFPRTVGLYVDSSVRILGVPVGKVTKITPEGTQVRVDIEYGSQYKLPVNVDAVLVPPSIVSDRYIQLAPVYSGGAVLPDHAVLQQDRTEVPLELDQIFGELNNLNVALGPQGANKNGALSRLVAVSAANLAGNGQQLHDTLQAFSEAITTLADNRYDLFDTLSNLQQFTTTLAQDDGGVRQVNADLAQVAVFLNGERSDLGLALRNLAYALGQVATFVGQNRSELTTDVSQLITVTNVLVKEKAAITEVLDDAPTALWNLALAYDPVSQTLRTRSDQSSPTPSPGSSTLTGLICSLLNQLPGLPGLPGPLPNPTSQVCQPSGGGGGSGGLSGLLGGGGT